MEGHIDPQETEEQKAARYAEQHLALELIDLKEKQPKIYLQYQTFLLQEQVELAKKNEGRPVKISVEAREQILGRAKSTIINGADPVKVMKDFNAYSTNGRPPIGGAPDD